MNRFSVLEVIPKNTPEFIQDRMGRTYKISRAYNCVSVVEAESLKRSKAFDVYNSDKRFVRSRNVVFEYIHVNLN